jgi:hypothetical protein
MPRRRPDPGLVRALEQVEQAAISSVVKPSDAGIAKGRVRVRGPFMPLDGALQKLVNHRYGSWPLGIVGAGLLAYAVF